jgi:hypothetical protein
MYFIIGLLLLFLIYFIINFVNKYVDYICYDMNKFYEQLKRTRN